MLKAHEATVTCDIRTDSMVMADPMRIEQVLHNLVGNAARYSEPGSAIQVYGAVQEQHMAIRVRDEGDGIPPEWLHRVFEPFVRGDNAHARGIPGTGLGLAVCKSIISAHGGQIWAMPNSGKGTTFAFVPPLARHSNGKS